MDDDHEDEYDDEDGGYRMIEIREQDRWVSEWVSEWVSRGGSEGGREEGVHERVSVWVSGVNAACLH
jgi:hypothetical protein